MITLLENGRELPTYYIDLQKAIDYVNYRYGQRGTHIDIVKNGQILYTTRRK